MTDAQTEARAIARFRIEWEHDDTGYPELVRVWSDDGPFVSYDDHATALAAKDAEMEGWKRTATEYASELHSLRSQLAEARKALGEIEQEARSLPLHTSAVTWEHVLTSKLAVVRDAARRALTAQETRHD